MTHAPNITMVAKILQSPFATACGPGQFQPRDHIFRNTINSSATRGSARSSTEGFRDPREAGSHHPEACHAHNEWRETKAGPNWKVIHEKTISTVGEISDVKKKTTPYDKRGNLKNYHGQPLFESSTDGHPAARPFLAARGNLAVLLPEC
jgi:hypothetical protein